MSDISIFIQVHGKDEVAELIVAETIAEAALYDLLRAEGHITDASFKVYIDDAEQYVPHDGDGPVCGLKHGSRVHVTHCHRVRVTVHYLDKATHHEFAPGVRVRTVKAWAVNKFELDHKDALEHVLQVCNSKVRPASDTPLHALTHGRECTVCFDLVPEKRIEG